MKQFNWSACLTAAPRALFVYIPVRKHAANFPRFPIGVTRIQPRPQWACYAEIVSVFREKQ